ncbi:hypothetical protein KO488_13925 [Poseidonibacter lekithochrous]|uniref:hypothetical protein n=1 Tax=Poseidonibacter TaxID=2321187 RepID=UPI001C090585|nr:MULTISPECIES: hypothetical protein [Poseidonibacter]MBU3015861.1 hypothetical protein [Poseidonibacter lekithochrous]MDO6829160.1 hypothetical protein [Poseidonibacter sp. 1_MG-2023]
MKKSIVLLISLFFISALSILIIKNLEDTNLFLEEKNHKINKTQILTSFNNIQIEISKIFKNNKNNITNIIAELNSEYIPIGIKDILISFTITEYDKVNINLLSNKDSKDYAELTTLFSDYEISNFDGFKYVYKEIEDEYKNTKDENEGFVKNNKQIDDIINIIIEKTYNNEILNIKNKLGFIKKNENEKLYELFVKVKYLNDFAKAYYILNEEGVVKYFESSFK